MSAVEERNAFDFLVSDLSGEEKKHLLEKIKTAAQFSKEQLPLIDEKQRIAPESVNTRYAKLSLLTKILYWIISLFTGRQPIDTYISSLTASEGRAINEKYPGMFDYEENMLKSGFKREIQALKDAARFFYSVLDASVQRDKGAFFGYLVSIEAAELHKNLLDGSDPERLAMLNPDISDAKLRANALEFVEETINSIGEESRHELYENSRMLVITKALSSFLFDRLIMSFTQKGQEEKAVCPVNIVHAQLCELANILFSLKVPSLDVLSALFLFYMTGLHGEDYDQDGELQKFLTRAEKSIAVIRHFNISVPLLPIIRCASHDFLWEPKEISGGEDWFNIYKNYWITRTNKCFSEWIRKRRNAELSSALEHYFNGTAMSELENAWSEKKDSGIPVDDNLMLSFLLSFHKVIFMPEINVVIRPILVDGEFYKKENRTEFLESYNTIIKLDDVIKRFDDDLSGHGEFGMVWQQIEGDMQSIPVRRRKTQTLLDQINTAAAKIINDAQKALASMQNVLSGILERGNNTAYDTLSNFAHIAGKGVLFTDALNKCVLHLKETIEISNTIIELSRDDIF